MASEPRALGYATAVAGNAAEAAASSGGRSGCLARLRQLRSRMSTRWAIFCEASSIRGMQKIIKAKSMFSKTLWTLFVTVMTLVLFITSGFLVRDFLNYDTAWHTMTEFDNKPEFPSFTLCSHNPFGPAAKAAWEAGTVLTPLEFQGLLKKTATDAVTMGIGEPLEFVFAYDNIDTYYQHLSYNETVSIGHNRSSLFFCVVAFSGIQMIAENCIFDALNITVKLYSHSEFFNCFTVESNHSRDFESIIVVMSLVPTQDLAMLNQSFLYDVLNKGEGVKVTMHEKGVMPDFAQNGFNVEPGRMNEVNYATTAWEKLRTPKQECRDNQPPIRHMNVEYVADYHQCANAQLQKQLLKQCSCLNSLWPVLRVPDKSVPYCIDVRDQTNLTALNARLSCVLDLLEKEKYLKTNLSASVCFPRCTYYTYESTLSITKWIPSPSKLEALVDQFKAQSNIKTQPAAFSRIIRKNISQYNSQTYNSRLSQQNAYTYIKIKRRNWDVTKKLEKLTLDANILLSRIGGLCSLCIGLTAAFAVEMIEFVYLSFRQPSSTKEPSSAMAAAAASSQSLRMNQHHHHQLHQQEEMLALEQAALLAAPPPPDPWEKMQCGADFGTQPNHSATRDGGPAR